MRVALELLAAAALLALATWAHLAFWTRRFRLPPPDDGTLWADTSDGWRLALARRRPRPPARRTPVLLVHGIAANHACMDFGMANLSLAGALAAAGYESFSLDLRGHGRSRGRRRGAPRTWSFDDYVVHDLPAAIDAVRAATGADRVVLVGHSQGGLLALAAAALHPSRVAAVVSIAAPVHFGGHPALALAARLGFLVTGRLNRFLARALSPYAGWWHPPISQVVWNANNVDGRVYRRVLVNVVEDIPPGVLHQFGGWIREDRWGSRDGEVDYRAALAGATQPAFFVGAVDDGIAPPDVVRKAHDAWGGTDKDIWIAGRQGGCGCEYGHSDLLFGRRAPQEIFPRIRDWLVARIP